MPYIADATRRNLLAARIAIPSDRAELAFTIATAVDDYFIGKAVSFSTLSDALAALQSVHGEVERRFLFTYEDRKLDENGEVFHNLARSADNGTAPKPERPYDWEVDHHLSWQSIARVYLDDRRDYDLKE